MGNKTTILVTSIPYYSDKPTQAKVEEDFAPDGTFLRGKQWVDFNTWRHRLLKLTGIDAEKSGVAFPDGAEESLGALFYMISIESSRTTRAVGLVREAINKSHAAILHIVDEMGEKKLPSSRKRELELQCFLYQYQWIMFDIMMQRGWHKNATLPERLTDPISKKIVAVLPEMNDLQDQSFRTRRTDFIHSATRRIDGLGMSDHGADAEVPVEIRLERLRLFIANHPSLINLARQTDSAEGDYRRQRLVETVDTPKTLIAVMRQAYEKGLFRRNMIPLLAKEEPNLLTAVLQINKIPKEWKDDIREHLPSDQDLAGGSKDLVEAAFDDSFFWNDARFVAINERNEWNHEDRTYLVEKITRAYQEGLCTEAASRALSDQFVVLIFSLFPRNSGVFKHFQSNRRDVFDSWEKSQNTSH